MKYALIVLGVLWVLVLPLTCEAVRLFRRIRRGRAASPSPHHDHHVVATAEHLVSDRYRILADLYDTPHQP
ncbi:hypothetical protein ABZ404_37230 [Streptomyces sp. NPDC005878]|uniref:hypothetical protein n=1 Tax=Streptomyces sp. NPDC005878 TaxID=3157077 RepID=UPI0033CA9BE6